ncbi:hypothetical protein HYH03_005755 [Edaphochlamys debaryana]|uniref:Uncharacterized protein n=1 Tax=Edaphochlamys debaryana TaxID=47281 RepID=A0A836C201_9CHLO|nr:hypothetical protein HYH03_005755 [Edaphochlamys debaryana]|eukprot:KAG2496153.1 hypothetical protein HYH03_005755 [Edaphochlamys debaryana]
MSQHQLHTGQTTISGIPHNDSVHNLLADQGATVYGNSAATSKLNIFEKRGNGLPAYMAAATPDQLSAKATKGWETMEKRGNGLAAATHDQLSAYARKAHLKRRQGMCQCGECKRCRGRASATRRRAAKTAAAKAVVGTLVEVVDLAED